MKEKEAKDALAKSRKEVKDITKTSLKSKSSSSKPKNKLSAATPEEGDDLEALKKKLKLLEGSDGGTDLTNMDGLDELLKETGK